MGRPKIQQIEYRNYDFPETFPIVVLAGEKWRISDIRSNRLHFHNCLEIGLCESDSGFMQFEDTECAFKAGDVSVVGMEVPHTTWSAPGCSSRWSYLFVDLSAMLRPYFPMALLTDEETLKSMVGRFYSLITPEQDPSLQHLVHMIVQEMTDKKRGYQASVRGLLLSFTTHLINLFRAQKKQVPDLDANNKKSASIMPALQYMRNHFQEDIILEDLPDLCHMSSTNFRRTFTSIMGKPPLTYLTELRIWEASTLLCSTNRSILDICETVGFRSVSSFNRHFLEIMDSTPREWRNSTSLLNSHSVLSYSGWLLPEIPESAEKA